MAKPIGSAFPSDRFDRFSNGNHRFHVTSVALAAVRIGLPSPQDRFDNVCAEIARVASHGSFLQHAKQSDGPCAFLAVSPSRCRIDHQKGAPASEGAEQAVETTKRWTFGRPRALLARGLPKVNIF